MLNCLCFCFLLLFFFFFFFFCFLFFDVFFFFFFVLFYAVKTDTKLTLHHLWNIFFIIQLTKIKFKIWRVIFLRIFYHYIFLGGWTSGFHTIDD